MEVRVRARQRRVVITVCLVFGAPEALVSAVAIMRSHAGSASSPIIRGQIHLQRSRYSAS